MTLGSLVGDSGNRAFRIWEWGSFLFSFLLYYLEPGILWKRAREYSNFFFAFSFLVTCLLDSACLGLSFLGFFCVLVPTLLFLTPHPSHKEEDK
jgi:hypothetical protein